MIDVIGTDAGAPASLPAFQQQLIKQAYLIATPNRLQPAISNWLGDTNQKLISSDDPRNLCKQLELIGDNSAAVLTSGDPLWFGIGRILSKRFNNKQLRFHPAPTSLQLAFARIGRPWQDASWLSLHARDPGILGKTLQKRPTALAVLTDPTQGGVESVIKTLQSSGLSACYELWLFENLGHQNERITNLSDKKTTPSDLHPLHLALLIAIEPRTSIRLPLFGLEDGVYLQQKDHPGLMTKREVRIQLLADLDLPEHGVIWDLGAGTGSVGLEALRLRPKLQLLTVEKRGGGAKLIKANASKLGVKPASVLEGDALELIKKNIPQQLSSPDRVILGGGGYKRYSLLKAVLEKLNPEGQVVIPIITLEAVAEIRSLLETQCLKVQISQLQAWRGHPLSDGTRLTPMNPTIIIKGTK